MLLLLLLLLLLLCVFNCFLPTHTERRLFFPNNVHIKRREGKKCKNFSKTEMNSFTSCLFVWLLMRRAFPSAFFSLFCLPFFSLSLSRLLFCDSSTSSQKHATTKISSDPVLSLSLSLRRRRRRRRRGRTRWRVAFASSLICASFLSFWSSEERKRKARRENSNINFGVAFPGKRLQRQYHHRLLIIIREKKLKKKKRKKKQKQVMADVITIIV